MGSGFYMPLDIAKTLMATRYILFARYAIKFALFTFALETGNSLIHSFLNLDLHTFIPSEFFAFSAGGTMQFLPLSDAIVFVL